MEYASNAKGNTAVALAGTALGGAVINGIVNWMQGQQKTEGDRPVTRYEMGLFQQMNAKDQEITLLKANQFTQTTASAIQQQLNAQAVYNAQANASIGFIQQQVKDLQSITKLTIPNENLNPGYGQAIVGSIPAPVPPPVFYYGYPPIPPPTTATTTTNTTTTTTGA